MSHSQNITLEQLIDLIHNHITGLRDISETTKIEALTADTNLFARTLNSTFGVTLCANDFQQLETVDDLLKMLNDN